MAMCTSNVQRQCAPGIAALLLHPDLEVRVPLQTKISDALHPVLPVEGQLDRCFVTALAQRRRSSRQAVQLSGDAGQLAF